MRNARKKVQLETKACRVCKETKPLDEFNKDRTKPDGHRNICRACRSRQNRSNVPDEKLRHAAYQRALKTLVERHAREFRQLVGRELVFLGGEKRWYRISG